MSCNSPYAINVYREAIPSFVSSIVNAHYFILTTQQEPNPPVDSPFSFKSYKTIGHLQSKHIKK